MAPRRRPEAGTGMFGTLLGAAVFLFLLLFAVQVLVGLYTQTVMNAAVYDAAKAVAGADRGDSRAARASAQANARSQLGEYGQKVSFDWGATTADVVVLEARGPRPSFLPMSLTGVVGLRDIVRTVTVRKEAVRPPTPPPPP